MHLDDKILFWGIYLVKEATHSSKDCVYKRNSSNSSSRELFLGTQVKK